MPNVTFVPVPGANRQFDIQGQSQNPVEAADKANGNVTQLQNSLKTAGLDAVFKIIAPATKPDKPLLAEDAPTLEKTNP